MQRKILTGKEARQQIYNGVKKVSDAVVSTLGPMGRNAVISRCFPSPQGLQYYMPFVTKDGVTVARNINLDDQLENTGANIIKQAAEKTMSDAGDGTTTTCLLMKAILEKGIELVDAGANPQELKKGIDAAVSYVVSELKKMAVPVGNDIEKIRQVATVSANNDSVIGDLIAEAFEQIGVDGIIDIEEAKGVKTEIKVSDGIKFSRGWESQYFINNKVRGACELENPYILLYDKNIVTFKQFGKLLDLLEGKPLLIICDNADGEVLAGFAMNADNGSYKSCIVRCPEFGEFKQEAMEDLAIITGGTYISDEKGKALNKSTLADLGRAKKVVISKDETVIISPEGNEEALEDLLNNLKTDLIGKEGQEKEKIEKRIAKLTGGVAVIYVGAPTEVEMKEKKDRVDDAIRATKAAISEGFIPGAGTAFIHSIGGNVPDGINKDAYTMLLNVLVEPLRQICKNAGVDEGDVISKVSDINNSNKNMGYNAKTNMVEDLVKVGIIDPVKVLRCSLENAASAATMILTSETLICDVM